MHSLTGFYLAFAVACLADRGFVQAVGFALGPLVAGITFDLTRSYDGAFQAFWLLSVIGTVLIGQDHRYGHRFRH